MYQTQKMNFFYHKTIIVRLRMKYHVFLSFRHYMSIGNQKMSWSVEKCQFLSSSYWRLLQSFISASFNHHNLLSYYKTNHRLKTLGLLFSWENTKLFYHLGNRCHRTYEWNWWNTVEVTTTCIRYQYQSIMPRVNKPNYLTNRQFHTKMLPSKF